MLAEQQATLARTQEIDNRTKALEDRLDDVARRLPSIADPGFGRAPGAVPTPAPATPPASIQTPPPTAELSASGRKDRIQSAALLACEAARTMARESSRMTSSQEPM
jgi:hypothetical protein